MDDIIFNHGFTFSTISESAQGERAARDALCARELKWGIPFLDDALGGIMPNDLIVIGSRSGAGKTQMATIIAQNNALAGKRVHYIALEAEQDEIARRMIFSMASRAAWPHLSDGQRVRMNYRAWYRGTMDQALGPYESEARAKLSQFDGLRVMYKDGDFDLRMLSKVLLSIQDQSDLIILDHLHYIDTDSGEEETRSHKDIVKRVRDISLRIGVPVILIVHLRKKDRMVRAPLVPDIDDVHGSSDIVKVATRVLLMGTGPSSTGASNWCTFLHCVKDRFDANVRRYVAAVPYSLQYTGYGTGYQLGTLKIGKKGEQEWEQLPVVDTPYWALNMTREMNWDA